jgi:hypothetical protein
MRSGLDVRVQYDVLAGGTHHRWAQVFVAGRQKEFRPGELTAADIEIHWVLDDALDVFAGRLDGTQAMAATTIVDGERDRAHGAPPPLDLIQRPEVADLPTIPGASLVVQLNLRNGPFGDVDIVQVFVDGRLNTMRLGTLPDADVRYSISYRDAVLVRQGSMTALEALESGSVSGSIGSLSLFAGLLESDALQRAQRATNHAAGLALAALGEINATPGYREALAEAIEGMGAT